MDGPLALFSLARVITSPKSKNYLADHLRRR